MAFMADQESNIAAFGGGGGGYGMSGSWTMIILVVVVLWLLFKDGHNNNNHNNYNYDPRINTGHCYDLGVNVKDMPDYMVDRDVLDQGCKNRAIAAEEGEKTRALINHNQERADDKAYQALVLQNLQQENAIQTLKLENNFQTQIAGLGHEVERGFAGISTLVDNISCNMAKRPPFYAQGFVPDGQPVPPCRQC